MKLAVIIAFASLFLLSGCQSEELISGQGAETQLKLPEDKHNLTAYPYEDVSGQEHKALNRALDDEYKALATYTQVIEDFGERKPFSSIVRAEENHVVALLSLYEKYDLPIIDDLWMGVVEGFDTFTLACEAAALAQEGNAALYDELLLSVDNQDITAVFISLRSASRNEHVQAFRRCDTHQ